MPSIEDLVYGITRRTNDEIAELEETKAQLEHQLAVSTANYRHMKAMYDDLANIITKMFSSMNHAHHGLVRDIFAEHRGWIMYNEEKEKQSLVGRL